MYFQIAAGAAAEPVLVEVVSGGGFPRGVPDGTSEVLFESELLTGGFLGFPEFVVLLSEL